jgi:methylglutaconyl-CoA hydratase
MHHYETISVTVENKVATIWLDRPEVQNAINLNMATELTKCFEFLEHSKDVRAILLRGKGPSFCSGADLKWMKSSGLLSHRKNLDVSMKMSKCYHAVYKSSKPTIAIAHGSVYAGAIGLVSACDMAIGTNDAQFALSEVRVGLAPATIMPYLLTRLSEHKARLLMITGKRIDADEALKAGLVDFIFSTDKLEENIQLILNDIFKGSPEAISESKRLFNEVVHKQINNKVLKATVHSIAKMKKSAGGQEGMSSFIDKKAPAWMNEK